MEKQCPYKNLLSPFMDAELSPKEMQQVENHLKVCETCQKEIGLLTRADKLMSDLPEIAPSKNFERSFWQNISKMEAQKEVWSFSRVFAFKWQSYFATALTILLITGGIIFFQKSSEPDADDIAISVNLELFQDYEMIDNLDLLENWEAIMTLEEAS